MSARVEGPWDGLRPESAPTVPPRPPGQTAVVTMGLAIGLLLMALQLWLLTLALELFLAGRGREVWRSAWLSGAVFAGGLVMLRLLDRRPRLRRLAPPTPETRS